MKNFSLLIVLGLGMALLITDRSNAQSDVTFQVDITHLPGGDEFNPDEDKIELIGNKHPLSATRPLELEQDEDEPTLFKVTVSFPMSMENSQLEYQFRALIDNRYRNEDIPRSLRITVKDETLDALYFNSYAW